MKKIFSLLICLWLASVPGQLMAATRIAADAPELLYTGRIDFSDKKALSCRGRGLA